MEQKNAIVIVGGLIEKDGKYLLIQEAKASCRGKWNLPAGHLDIGENIFEGAKREIKEETGCDVELTGVCQIGNRKCTNMVAAIIIFTTKIINETINILNPNEILDIKWFTYEEIIAMRDQIRNTDLLIGSIDNYRNNIVAPLELVRFYREGDEAYKNVTMEE